MKILRSLDRRNSTLVPTGWFTTLAPKRWFPASRPSGSFRYPVSQSRGVPSPQAHESSTRNPTAMPPPESASEPAQKGPGHADSLDTAIFSQSMMSGVQDRQRMRTALIVLAATGAHGLCFGICVTPKGRLLAAIAATEV